MINLAIIGYGYWGPNLVRNFNSIPNCSVKWIVDERAERLNIARRYYPAIKTTIDFQEVLNDEKVTAVVIATPVHLHFQLAKQALEGGKHVLLEKPMTRTVDEAKVLIDLSQKKNLLLMTDHTFLYTGAVKKIKSLIEANQIGDLLYFDSSRINLGLFQTDINVLWDLAPHDISILLFLNQEKPRSVVATGVCHTNNELENIAYLTLYYNSNFIAHLTCSWSSPVKIRNILIGGTKKMIVYNDVEPTEKLKIYDTGFNIRNDKDKQRLLIDYRIGDINVPKVETTEALKEMAEDFTNCMTNNNNPVSDKYLGLAVVKVLEAAQESIKNAGKEIYINW